jgi:hypothetical protein
MTIVLSVPPEAPFVVVVVADGEEPYFPPPPEDAPVVDLPEEVVLPVLEHSSLRDSGVGMGEYTERVGESYNVGPP